VAFRKIQTPNLISDEASFDDPLIIFNKSNKYQTDVGWLAKRLPNTYSGLVRDSETNKFYLIDSVVLNSHTLNDINPLVVEPGTLVVKNIEATKVEAQTTFVVPTGDTSERNAQAVQGEIRFNTDTNLFEGFDGTSWIQMIPSTHQEIPE
jgi:hypothetical protein